RPEIHPYLCLLSYSFETGDCMDIKKKREKLITIIVAIGIFVPILTLIFGIYKLGRFLVPVNYCFCFVAFQISKLIAPFVIHPRIIFFVFIIIYVLNYLFLGWIIARLVYPNKKLLPEPDTPSEPTQD
ncbi:MAG: hypothetical protein KAS17_10010, partial [Victivallaceae bacterium]|nr:hypothetical protein [Victivallaceae bacterium]